ncbi:pyridoxine 5'-phosphate synthase [Sinimarinibacterium sp. CAU 1509]|uniref:pyridoxine 5'-phosphate synthase n=1 Tax=Sinimarinibacterium sp. CAU 1509 TaxID=2562283 RepID=UPI0010ABD702|nr:pyridoxine 5'-phosphate synthase [Sinimarinibacterium sp. CAU 1509]TJY63063.1 pyridoxine 5'-phosphate synthase [Sinimarinibacterium sp. CAU 1509]
MSRLRLGINVDHVATLRQARGTAYPDPVEAALLCAGAGADSITIHLREDRRHIQPDDVRRLQKRSPVPVNLEMAVTDEMVAFACRVKPRYACLVPEKREELTTEGGLDVASLQASVAVACRRLQKAGIEVSLFIDPSPAQLKAALAVGVPHLEIHTGRYADTRGRQRDAELKRIVAFAAAAADAGFEVHAGHGLTCDNVGSIASIRQIVELNIGHSIIARAVFVGLPAAVAEMRQAMTAARGA